MFKQLKFGLLALLAVTFFACQSGNEATQEEKVANETPVQPQTAPQAQTPAAPVAAGPTTTVEFEETTFDFGTIDQGEKASHVYKFKNTGSEPLILSDAKGSCGCTVPSWPREAIAPGETGEIKVEFNSKNKKGQRNQKVTITANTNPAQTFIYLKGVVNAPEGQDAAGGQPQIKIAQ